MCIRVVVPQIVRRTITARELVARRRLIRLINGVVRYAQAKIAPYGFDAQVEQYGNVYRITMTVEYRDLPPEPEVIIGDAVKDGL
jgi:hypothetical protein